MTGKAAVRERRRTRLASARRFRSLLAERLEDRSLLAALMGYQIRVVPPDGPLTQEISTINVGQTYDVVVTVQDLRRNPDGVGVFAAYLDITYDSTKTRVQAADNPTAFKEAFRARVIPDVNPTVLFPNSLNAGNLPNRIDDVGAAGGFLPPYSGIDVAELVRGRFQATAAGTVTFAADLTSLEHPSHATLLHGRNNVLLTSEMDAGTSRTLTIVAPPITANPDLGTTLANLPTAINVLANDTTTPATGQTKNVVSVTQGTNGQVSFTANNVTYTPNVNFTGTDSFTYAARNVTAGATSATSTATVTVTVANARLDASGDGVIAPSDVALLVNYFNTCGGPCTEVPPNLDVQPDGFLTPSDFLPLYDFLSGQTRASDGAAGGGPNSGTPAMRLTLSTTDNAGVPITNVALGDNFVLKATVQDLRAAAGGSPRGVFASYADITYDSSKVSVAGAITPGTSFTNGPSGNASVVGLLDEVGGFAGPSPLGTGQFQVFSVPLKADATGTVNFAALAPAIRPMHHSLVFGVDAAAAVEFVNATLTVTAAAGPITANPDPVTTTKATPVTINVLANDTTSPTTGQTKNVVSVTQPSGGSGTVAFTATNVTYTPNANFTGTDSFTYTARNTTAGATSPTSTSTVTVTVSSTLMRYQVRLVEPDGRLFTADPQNPSALIPTQDLTSVSVGQSYDLAVTVEDLRPLGDGTGDGVFAGFLDIGYDSAKARVQAAEIQRLHIGPFAHQADPGAPVGDKATGTTGLFTLALQFATGTETTAPINYSGVTQTLMNNITNALNALPSIDNDPDGAGPLLGGVQVTPITFDNTQVQFDIRFLGSLFDKDVPNVTIASQNLTRTGAGATLPAPTVTMTYEGDLQGGPTPYAFNEAFRSRGLPTIAAVSDGKVFYPTMVSAGNQPNLLDNVGAVGNNVPPLPGHLTSAEIAAGFTKAPPRELVRARLIATAAGPITFAPSLTNLPEPVYVTLIYGRNPPLTLAEMDLGASKTLTVTGASGSITALGDNLVVVEDSQPTTFDVLINDTTPEPGQTKNVVSVTQPSNGSVTFTTTGVTYAPSLNFSGIDSFTYAARNITAGASSPTSTAIVTVTVVAVNDPPTLNAIDDQALDVNATKTVNLSGISPGGGPGEAGQAITVAVTSSNTALLNPTVSYTSPSATGTVTLAPAANQTGTATVTITVRDVLAETSRTFTVIVNPVQPAGPLMKVKLVTTDLTGAPLTTIAAGSDFLLKATVEDLRAQPQGVLSSYVDVTYGASQASVNGPIAFGPTFPNVQSGNAATPGLLDEVGALINCSPTCPPGSGENLLFTVPFRASGAGTLNFTLDSADLELDHPMFLLGINNPISLSQIEFVHASLQVETRPDLLRYQIRIVPPGGALFQPNPLVSGTTIPTADLTTLKTGETYDLVVTVEDLRGGSGAFAGFLDIHYDSGKTQLQASEIQVVHIGPFTQANGPSSASGTFNLEVGSRTTADITYTSNPDLLANRIRLALEALDSIEPGDVQVTANTLDATQLQFTLRFGGKLLGQNVPNANVTSPSELTGPTDPAAVVTHDGDLENGISSLAFREAFRSFGTPTITNVASGRIYFATDIAAGNQPNLLDDVGAIGNNAAPLPGELTAAEIAAGYDTPPPRELVRARFIATTSGVLTFAPDLSNIVTPAHDSLLHGLNIAVPISQIDLGDSKTLIIDPGPINAFADQKSVAEDSTATVIDVLTNDITIPAADQTKNVIAVTQPANGTVTFTATGVSYTPADDFVGVDTFTYVARNITAGPDSPAVTAAVNVTVTPVNDEPSFGIGVEVVIYAKDEDGPQSIDDFAADIAPGPLDEGDQAVEFLVANDNEDLFSVQPKIDSSGKLTFTPQFNAEGIAQVAIVLKDSGGKQDGGIDESEPQIFAIVIEKERPGHNVEVPLDSSGDGKISSIDALLCVNFLNRFGTQPVPENSPFFVDTNGDGKVSPIDLLLIFNHLNRQQPGGEGESASPSDSAAAAGEQSDDLIGLLAFDAAELQLRRRRAR